MSLKTLTAWLKTAEGFGRAFIALLGMPVAIWIATAKALNPIVAFLRLPAWTTSALAVLVVAAFVLAVHRSYRRFTIASRIVQPDAFTLHPMLRPHVSLLAR